MTIASEITRIQTNIADAYTAAIGKGATMPATENSDNLATCIASIPSGGGSGIGIPREVKNGVYQVPTESFTFSWPNDATDVGDHGFQNAFTGCTAITSADFSSLTTMSGDYSFNTAFSLCTGLTSVDFSSLTTVSGNNGLTTAFNNCTGLTSVDFSSLTTVSGKSSFARTLQNCTGLTSVDFPSLTTVSGDYSFSNAFTGCTALTDVYFRALTTSSFGSYKNQFNNMMNSTGSTKTHTIHFPSNMQSTISGLTGYPLFGGSNGSVVLSYDLPATS